MACACHSSCNAVSQTRFDRRCVSAVVSLPLAHGQTAPGLLLDAYYPGMNAGADVVNIPASASSAFIFEIHSTATSSAGANPQPLQTYTRGFPVVGCNVNGIWNISFAQLYTPEQSTDFAVHLSNRIPFPNNVTGESWTLEPNAYWESHSAQIQDLPHSLSAFSQQLVTQLLYHVLQVAATAQTRAYSL